MSASTVTVYDRAFFTALAQEMLEAMQDQVTEFHLEHKVALAVEVISLRKPKEPIVLKDFPTGLPIVTQVEEIMAGNYRANCFRARWGSTTQYGGFHAHWYIGSRFTDHEQRLAIARMAEAVARKPAPK